MWVCVCVCVCVHACIHTCSVAGDYRGVPDVLTSVAFSVPFCLCSWLMHDPNMRLRSSYPPFLVAVSKYFDRLFGMLNPLQASRGGPIIAFQIENEYLYYGKDKKYMEELYHVSCMCVHVCACVCMCV